MNLANITGFSNLWKSFMSDKLKNT